MKKVQVKKCKYSFSKGENKGGKMSKGVFLLLRKEIVKVKEDRN